MRVMNLKPLAPVGGGGAASGPNGIHIIEPLCAVFRRKLKSEGLKYTPERAQILDEIIRRDDPGLIRVAGTGPESGGRGGVFEAEELMASMRKKGLRVSKATVYRTIKLLAESGIIQQVLFDSDQAHYQLAYGKRAAGLLVNVDTKQITPVELPELAAIRDRVCREHGLEPEGHRLVIYGRSGAG
jgi:Fur family ferric uptake transcriptional regulator